MCATVFVDRSMPTPDLNWRITWFVCNLGQTREEVAFYIANSPRFHTSQVMRQLRSWEYGEGILRF